MRIFWRCVLGAMLIVAAGQVWGEDSNRLDASLYQMSTRNANDISKLKLLAERGLADAQFKLAQACVQNQFYADALKWYSLASKQGMLEASYQMGRMLLYGCHDARPDQNVIARPTEGLKYCYMAATNGNIAACFDVAGALKDGIGCPVNMVQAYAWFSLCSDNGNSASAPALNWLALRMTGEEIRQAIAASRLLKNKQWLSLNFLPANNGNTAQNSAPVDIKLKLSGMVFSPRGNMAVINKHTLAEGETITMKSDKNELVNVTCVSVQPDLVQVRVQNESDLRSLHP